MSIRILVAEDNVDSRTLMELTLEDGGFEVQSCGDGAEALILIRRSPPELIISDILMPGMDGFELCHQVKQIPTLADIPFIFCTATYVAAGDRQLADHLGAARFILKPIEPDSFIDTLHEVLAENGFQTDNTKPAIDTTTVRRLHDERITHKLDHKVLQLEEERKAHKEVEQRFNRLVTHLSDEYFFYRLSLDGCFSFVSPSIRQVLGYSEDEFIGRHYRDFLIDDFDKRQTENLMQASLEQHQQASGEAKLLDKHGAVHHLRFAQVPVFDDAGAVTAVEGVAHDVSELRQAQERLSFQANYDTLTHLPNRNLVLDRLTQAILHGKRSGHGVGLLFIDLDRFKQINDTHGHGVGDTLLQLAARRLETCIRSEDTLSRLSGDEFLIILPGITGVTPSEKVANKILEAFRTSFEIENKDLFITTSIGLAVYPDDGEDPSTLLSNADIAMYKAKDAGRNTCRFFTREMDEQARKRIEMESYLRHALSREQLDVHYQPLVDLGSGKTLGVEALLRWNHPKLGQVSPEVFISIAEDSGLIIPISEWVLEQSCLFAKNQCEQQSDDYYVAINVSARQFWGEGLIESITDAIARHNIAPENLMLEVTESLLMRNIPETTNHLNQLREMGVLLAIDDFGTGFSSLSYLKRFPFTHLKIDRSFIRGIMTDPEDAILTKTIIQMAHSLGLIVVAEGVETEEQQRFLQQQGCDIAQGFFYG